MYRKRSGSGYSKRRTNIYDPQGVYKKGLTKKQKIGMSKQVKLQYLEVPKPRITRQLLDEYKKTLQFYGIATTAKINTINMIRTVTVPYGVNENFEITSANVMNFLQSIGVKPLFFQVNSFQVKRITADFPTFGYWFYYGNGNSGGVAEYGETGQATNSNTCVVPCYWKKGNILYSYQLEIDNQYDDMILIQHSGEISPSWTDLSNAPYDDGDLMPFIKYPVGPDGIDPKIRFQVTGENEGYDQEVQITLNITVVY